MVFPWYTSNIGVFVIASAFTEKEELFTPQIPRHMFGAWVYLKGYSTKSVQGLGLG